MPDDDSKMDTSESAVVSIHLQQFWPTNPRDWFNHAEILFDVKNIKSDKMKWGQVIASLPAPVMAEISDVLARPPTDNKYEFIKKVLLERLQPSEERRMETLLAGQDLGDRKPSEALRHIRGLAGDKIGESVIRSIWTRRLPEVIKLTMLSQADDASTDSIAKLADKLHDALNTSTSLSAFSRSPQNISAQKPLPKIKQSTYSNSLDSRLTKLEAKVDSLTNMMRSRSRSSSRNVRVQRGNYQTDPNSDLCFYHQVFKQFATKCVPPCKWRGEDRVNKPGKSKPGNNNSKNS